MYTSLQGEAQAAVNCGDKRFLVGDETFDNPDDPVLGFDYHPLDPNASPQVLSTPDLSGWQRVIFPGLRSRSSCIVQRMCRRKELRVSDGLELKSIGRLLR